LGSSLIAGAWADQQRLHERSLTELAQSEPAAAVLPGGDLVDGDADVMHQLLDLSVVDARYLPALLETTLVHIVDAWEQANPGAVRFLVAPVTADPVWGGQEFRHDMPLRWSLSSPHHTTWRGG
jgi:hypothetical protein